MAGFVPFKKGQARGKTPPKGKAKVPKGGKQAPPDPTAGGKKQLPAFMMKGK